MSPLIIPACFQALDSLRILNPTSSTEGDTYENTGMQSYHIALTIVLFLVKVVLKESRQQQKSMGHYEIMWERHPTVQEVMSRAWGSKLKVGDLGAMAGDLKEVLKDLKNLEQG